MDRPARPWKPRREVRARTLCLIEAMTKDWGRHGAPCRGLYSSAHQYENPPLYLRTHAPRPITGGAAGRHFIQPKKRTQPVIATPRRQIFPSSPVVSKHQDDEQGMNRRAVSSGAARARRFTINQVATAHRPQICAIKRQPAPCRRGFAARRQLERRNCPRRRHRTPKGEWPTSANEVYLLQKIGLFRVAWASVADVGAIAQLDYFPFM
jgi:hypothetical protein